MLLIIIVVILRWSFLKTGVVEKYNYNSTSTYEISRISVDLSYFDNSLTYLTPPPIPHLPRKEHNVLHLTAACGPNKVARYLLKT